MAVKPRILADDLHILASGPRHLEWFTHAFDKTHLHLMDMGAKIAPHKSLTFSSDNTARQWLKMHRWRTLQRTVPVITTCRDLGARLNSMVDKKTGKTLTDRMQKATGCAETIVDPWLIKSSCKSDNERPSQLAASQSKGRFPFLGEVKIGFVLCVTYHGTLNSLSGSR